MHRYRHVRRPDHPFATKDGTIQKHRLVLWEKVGSGPQRCHWCGRDLVWIKGGRGGNAVMPDHVDGDERNNVPENIVPSCTRCNIFRRRSGPRSIISDGELFVERGGGRRERAIERTCEHCGRSFLSPAHRIAKGRGRFCSASCRSRHTNHRMRPNPQVQD